MNEEGITSRALIKRIEDFGEIKNVVHTILMMDIFDQLSKHNPIWDSENEKLGDFLWNIRGHFMIIQDRLGEICDILSRGEDDNL
jgi:hypothetical protein